MPSQDKQYYFCRFCDQRINAGSLSTKPSMVSHLLNRHPELDEKYKNVPIDESLKLCFELRGEKS